MEHSLLKLMHDTEDSWWYRGRAFVVDSVLRRAKVKKYKTALDFGAGYGGMYSFLRQHSDIVDAYEPDSEASRILLGRGYRCVYGNTEQAFVEKHGIIALFDVLEHIEDDNQMLVRLRDALTEDGTLIITVPAYKWLWSHHDERNHHFRRYMVCELREKLKSNGFDVKFVGYWNTTLFPVAALMRLFGIAGEGGLSPSRWVNSILLQIIRFEALITRIVPLPFGLSVVAIALKKK